jgi:hypothetical protein
VNTNIVHNTYINNSVNRQVNANRASFNGPNGVNAEPTAEQRAAAENPRKMPATSEQRARQEAAAKDRNLQASENKGHPNADAINSFDKREQHGKGAGAEHGKRAGAQELGAGAGQGENKPGKVSEHRGQGAGNTEQHGNKRNVEGSKGKARSGKTAKHEGSARGPHEMTQKSRQPKMAARGPQMGGKHPQAGGNRGPATEQQKGKKKEGKPEKQHGHY